VSSRRYKTGIRSIGALADRVQRLRPVSFRYRTGPESRQYGLIAEEVAKVFPELVVRGRDGTVETVAYQLLPPLLLAELQRQERRIERLDARLRR
jgi:hypothetical protein